MAWVRKGRTHARGDLTKILIARRRFWYAVGLAAALVVALALARNAIVRVVLGQVLSLSTGYHVAMEDLRIEANHAALINAHITRRGDPVLDAARIDIYYNLRDLLPGSKHRFGFVGASINAPVLTIIHHRDGTYNVAGPAAGPSALPQAAAARPNNTPLDYYARVRNGMARLIDDYQYYKDARSIALSNINADIVSKSNDRTHFTLSALINDTKPVPLRAVGTIDYHRGFAMHRIRAQSVPIKALGNYLINSPAAHILAGTAHDLDARIYSLDVRPNVPISYHVSARARLSDAQLAINGLTRPIRNLRGMIQIFDGGLAAKSLDATIAGVPLAVAGAIYNFSAPQFYLGVRGQGPISQLKTILAFGARYPLSGDARVATLIEGPIGKPAILVHFSAPRVQYDSLPLDNAQGLASLYNNAALLVPLTADYGGLRVTIRGAINLGKHVASEMALHYTANSSDLPVISAFLPNRPIVGDAAVGGTDAQLGASGYLADASDFNVLGGFYDFSSNGVGTFGPLAVRSGAGELIGSYVVDRPHNESAFWVSAQNVVLARARNINLPGFPISQLPPVSGNLDALDVAGGGAPSGMTLAGRMRAHDLQAYGLRFAHAGAAFAGNMRNLNLPELVADGPWGSYNGQGNYDGGSFATRGALHADLASFSQFAPGNALRGRLDGTVALARTGAQTIVQTQDAHFQNASIRGIAVQAASGTIAMGPSGVQVYAAHAVVAGADTVAAGSLARGGQLAIATSGVGPQLARALGIPLEAGTVSAVGVVGSTGATQTFNGGLAIAGGRAAGFPVSASTEVNFNGSDLVLANAGLIVGNTYSSVAGSVNAVQSGAPQYHLRADVPVGDIATAAQTLGVPAFRTTGSFSAALNVTGRGAQPFISGPLQVPVGSVNGLNFSDASASIAADRGGVLATGGRVLVGTTVTHFNANVHPAYSAISINAPHADLSDFNDFFNTGDTLGGNGSVNVAFTRAGDFVSTTGDVDVKDLRYRRLPIGDTHANWSSRNGVVDENVHVGGEHGALGVVGTIGLAPETTMDAIVAHSRYAVHASLRGLDLSTWLPALGYPTVPVTGRVNANASVFGRYPHLSIASNATMLDGTFGRIPIDRVSLVAGSSGSNIRLSSVQIEIPSLVAQGSGTFGLERSSPIAFLLQARSSDLPHLATNFTKAPVDIHGNLQSSLSIGGTWSEPKITAGVDLTNGNIYGVNVPNFIAALAFNKSNVVVRNAEVNFNKGSIAIAGALPLSLAPFGIGPPGAPFSFDFFAQNVDVAAFDPLLPNGTKIGGALNGRVALGGTVHSPQIRGRLALTAGSYVSKIETVPITQAVADIVFNRTTATVDKLSARLGRGSLNATGDIAFGRGVNGDEVSYAANLTTRGATLNFPAYGSGTLDSNLHLVRAPGRGVLAHIGGDATISDAVIPFAALLPHGGSSGASGGQGGGGASLPFNVAFDGVNVTAAKNVAVRANALGFGLDIGGRGRVQLAGTLQNPTLDGRFNSSGGTLTFVGTLFKIQQGSVTFNPANGAVPTLYAVASAHVANPDPDVNRNPTGSADITITLTGLATNPNLAFSSSPTGYTRDQIIGLLTPLGAVAGIAFDENGNPLAPGQLPGAPAMGSGQPLPPGVRTGSNGTLSVGQEAFNILNAQFTRSLLSPIENVLGNGLGLSNVNLTLDYTGAVGLSFRRPLSDRLYAVYANTFGYPNRQTYGLEYQPNEVTSANLTFFMQSAPSGFFGNQGAVLLSSNQNVTAGQPLTGQDGFTLTVHRLFW